MYVGDSDSRINTSVDVLEKWRPTVHQYQKHQQSQSNSGHEPGESVAVGHQHHKSQQSEAHDYSQEMSVVPQPNGNQLSMHYHHRIWSDQEIGVAGFNQQVLVDLQHGRAKSESHEASHVRASAETASRRLISTRTCDRLVSHTSSGRSFGLIQNVRGMSNDVLQFFS